MTKVLLTGASGFVGKSILKELIKNNVDTKLILRKDSELDNELLKYCSIEHVNDLFDLTYKEWLFLLQKVDIIIHSAWYVKNGDYLKSKKNEDCLKGTLRMIKAASNTNVNCFVGIGSCYEYDFSYCNDPLSIKTPLSPKTPYSQAKVSVLKNLKVNKLISGMNYSWCRLFYLHGEGENQNRLIPYIHNQLKKSKPVLLSDPNKIRDYINVIKAGKMIAYIASNKIYGEHNICSGEANSIGEIAKKIADEYGRRDLLKFGRKESEQYEPSKIIGKPTEIISKIS